MQLESIRAMAKMQVTDAVPVLHRLLQSEDYLDIEDEIFKALAQIGTSGDELLIQLLESGNARTRRRVVRALGISDSVDSLKSLARALKDRQPEVRVATLKSLAQRKQAITYLPIVLHLFKDPDAEVRKAAIEAAQELGKHLEGDKVYAQLPGKLLPMLEDEDPIVSTAVLNTLSRLNWRPEKKTADSIIRLLSQSDGDCFNAACQFISRHGLVDAIEDISLLLKKNALEDEQKHQALLVLGTLKRWTPEIQLLLSKAIYDPVKIVRLAALEALATLDAEYPTVDENPESGLVAPVSLINQALQGTLAPPLSQRFIPVSIADESRESEPNESPARDDSGEADIAFSNTDDAFVDQALDEISKSLKAGETPVPLSTLDSIAVSCVEKRLEAESLADDGAPIENTLSEEEQETLREFLNITQANKETAKWLFNREKVPVELDIQRLAARILGKIGSGTALDRLLNALDVQDSELRREATLSITQLARKQTLTESQRLQLQTHAQQALLDDNRDLRIAALRALGDLGDESSIDSIASTFEDPEVAVRIHGIHALSELSQRMGLNEVRVRTLLNHLLSQLQGNETGVHRAVAESVIPMFGQLNGSAAPLKEIAIEGLINAGLAGSDGQVKEMSRGLLALDKQRANTCLLERLEQLDTSVERRYVVEMLGELNRPNAGA